MNQSDVMQALTEDPGRDQEDDVDHLEKMTDFKSYSKVRNSNHFKKVKGQCLNSFFTLRV